MDRRGFVEGQPIYWWACGLTHYVQVCGAVEIEGKLYEDSKRITHEALDLCKPAYIIEYALLALERDIRRQL